MTVAIIGVLTSVIGAFYYLRIVRVMYFEDAEDPLDSAVSRELKVLIVVTAFIICFFFIQPNLILEPAAAAAKALLAG